jgi:hypothetical protein
MVKFPASTMSLVELLWGVMYTMVIKISSMYE